MAVLTLPPFIYRTCNCTSEFFILLYSFIPVSQLPFKAPPHLLILSGLLQSCDLPTMPSSIFSVIYKYSNLHHWKIFMTTLHPWKQFSALLPPTEDGKKCWEPWPDTMQRVRHLGTLSPKQGVSIKLFPKRAHGTPWKKRQKECKRPEKMKNTKKTRLSKPTSSTHIWTYRDWGSIHMGLHQLES